MFPPAVYRINALFTRHGHSVRVVGGWVRDKIRNLTPKDLDLATTATPDQVIAICEAEGLSYVTDGAKHGTIGIIIDHEMFEVTTLRSDVSTDGRHAEVEFHTDWERDAQRRDFTFNAMSMDLDGTLHDYFDGRKHLDEGRVVFVGDPEARIREDYLRILRYFRFCGRIGDLNGWFSYRGVLIRNVRGFAHISGERVWLEMSKILAGDNAPYMMDAMHVVGLYSHIGIPHVDTVFDVVEPYPDGTTVWKGPICYKAADAWEATRNPITVLAALTSYRGVADSWKVSRQERLLLHWLQDRRDHVPTLAELKEVATSPIGKSYAVEWAALHGPSAVLEAIRAWEVPVFPVQGRDLIHKGVIAGPTMGDVMRRMEARWRDSDYQLTKEQLVETANG